MKNLIFNHVELFSVEITRRATAEEYPRNFALIRLAERTIERQKKEEEEKARAAAHGSKAEDEIAELQRQIA